MDAVKSATLTYGDYSTVFTDGTIPTVYFERKSLGDLWGTMTTGYKRFKAEVNRARIAGDDIILIIECSLTEVQQGFDRSKFSGDSMVQKLYTLMVRYNLRVVFCTSRAEMSRYIVEYYSALGREYVRDRKD